MIEDGRLQLTVSVSIATQRHHPSVFYWLVPLGIIFQSMPFSTVLNICFVEWLPSLVPFLISQKTVAVKASELASLQWLWYCEVATRFCTCWTSHYLPCILCWFHEGSLFWFFKKTGSFCLCSLEVCKSILLHLVFISCYMSGFHALHYCRHLDQGDFQI